jgi:hypothetical protein
VHAAGPRLELVEQRFLGQTEVRALVVWRNAALVTPPDTRPAPVGLALGGQLVSSTRRRPARERDLAAGSGALGEQIRDLARCGLSIACNDDLDVAGD